MRRAPMVKRLKYVLHLLVPAIEFLFVIVCILVFNRCTPLSPSVDPNANKKTVQQPTAPTPTIFQDTSEKSENAELEADFDDSGLREVILTSDSIREEIIKEPSPVKGIVPADIAQAIDNNKSLQDVHLGVKLFEYKLSAKQKEILSLRSKKANLKLNLRKIWQQVNANFSEDDLLTFHEAWENRELKFAFVITLDVNKTEVLKITKRELMVYVARKKENNAIIKIKRGTTDSELAKDLEEAIADAKEISVVAYQAL